MRRLSGNAEEPPGGSTAPSSSREKENRVMPYITDYVGDMH